MLLAPNLLSHNFSDRLLLFRTERPAMLLMLMVSVSNLVFNLFCPTLCSTSQAQIKSFQIIFRNTPVSVGPWKYKVSVNKKSKESPKRSRTITSCLWKGAGTLGPEQSRTSKSLQLHAGYCGTAGQPTSTTTYHPAIASWVLETQHIPYVIFSPVGQRGNCWITTHLHPPACTNHPQSAMVVQTHHSYHFHEVLVHFK